VAPTRSVFATDTEDIAKVAGWFDDRPTLWRAFDAVARQAAEQAHPQRAALRVAADAAQDAHEQAGQTLAEACRRRDERLGPFVPAAWTRDPVGRLAGIERDIAATRQELTDARTRIATLTAEPALRGQPPDRLTREREAWRTRRLAGSDQRGSASLRPTAPVPGAPRPETERLGPSLARPGAALGIDR
jgi:exodeoxyribonuclease V alpha subunit